MSGRSKFTDRERFAAMWLAEMPAAEIAAAHGASTCGVYAAAQRFGLAARGNGWRPQGGGMAAPVAAENAPPEKPKPSRAEAALARLQEAHAAARIMVPEGWSLSRDRAVLRSGGRLAEISALAARWRMPSRRVMARWHVVRRL